MHRSLAPIACLILCAACVSRGMETPTAPQMASAEIGEAPDLALAKRAAETLIRSRLPHPSTALFDFQEMQRGWYRIPYESARFSWELVASVKMRDYQGAYLPEQVWSVHFRDGLVVAYARPVEGKFAAEMRELAPPIPLTGELPSAPPASRSLE